MNRAFTFALALATCFPVSANAAPQPSAATDAPVQSKVAAAQRQLRAAVLSNDAEARVKLYRADARSMPEYQPALHGVSQIAAYHRALGTRLKMTRFDPVTTEEYDFGHAVLEFGTFTAAWSTATGGTEERRGKYVNLWGVEPDGSLRLKSDIWGYFENLTDPKLFFVAMPEEIPATGPPSAVDLKLAGMIKRLNDEDARAVRTRDLEAKLAFFTSDAVLMPFADAPKHGMSEIRPYLTAYTAAGDGITFDDVRVWNAGFEDFGDYVVEYSKFHVSWRWPDSSGETKGGGLILWKRQPDGTLKRYRQIGTHDFVQ